MHQMLLEQSSAPSGNRMIDNRFFVQAWREEVHRLLGYSLSATPTTTRSTTPAQSINNDDQLETLVRDSLQKYDLLDPGQLSTPRKVLHTTIKQQLDRALHTAWVTGSVDSILVVADSQSSSVLNMIHEAATQSNTK